MAQPVAGLAEAYTDGQMKFVQLVHEARLQHRKMLDAHAAEQEAFIEKMVLKCQTILSDTVQDFLDRETKATVEQQVSTQANLPALASRTPSKVFRASNQSAGEGSETEANGREPFKAGRSFLYASVGNEKWGRRVDALLDHLPTSMRRSPLVKWMPGVAQRTDKWLARRAYHHSRREETCAGKLVHHPVFEVMCLLVIFLNVGYTIYSTDSTMRELSENPSMTLLAVDVGFLAFYTFEVCLRVYVYRMYYFFSFDWVWNWFDALILFLGYADVLLTFFISQSQTRRGNPIFLRLLRVIRVSKAMRVLRGIRFCWELQFFFDMVRKSVMSFLWCTLVAMFFNMFFACILVQLSAQAIIEGTLTIDVKEDLENDFGSVATGMLTLFQLVTGGKLWNETWRTMQSAGDLQAAFLVGYLVVYQLGIINLVVSMYVAKGSSLMKPVEDDLNWQSREDGIRIAQRMEQMIEKKASFIPGRMTEGEFSALLDEPGMRDIMDEHALSRQDALTLFSALLDADGSGSADIASVVDGFTRMRGYATSLDMLTLMYEVKVAEKGKKDIASRTERKIDMLTRATSMNHLLAQPHQDNSARYRSSIPAKPPAFDKPHGARSASVPPQSPPKLPPYLNPSAVEADAMTKFPTRTLI